MRIAIKQATYEQKSTVRNLLELYKYDFTEFDPEDVNESGRFEYRYLDHYWTESTRFPFLVRVDGKLAGFALVHEEKPQEYNMSEFFILKKYRKNGIGKHAAFEIFNQFPGRWDVAEMKENIPAQKFWRKIIGEYTNNHYEEITIDDWDGPIQAFYSGETNR